LRQEKWREKEGRETVKKFGFGGAACTSPGATARASCSFWYG
jgi:hypothetical protein